MINQAKASRGNIDKQVRQKVSIPKEMVEIIRVGRGFEELIKQPAWTLLLDQISVETDKKLKAMRQCRSNDPKVQSAMMNDWRAWEGAFQRFQEMALEPVKAKLETEEEVKAIIRQGMGEISKDQEDELIRTGAMPEGSSNWDFQDDDVFQ